MGPIIQQCGRPIAWKVMGLYVVTYGVMEKHLFNVCYVLPACVAVLQPRWHPELPTLMLFHDRRRHPAGCPILNCLGEQHFALPYFYCKLLQ